MKIVDRNKAIRLIYAKANELGFDYDFLHTLFTEMMKKNIISYPNLRAMPAKDIHTVLSGMFKINLFVKDNKTSVYLRRLMRQNKEIDIFVNNVLKRSKKRSIYEMSEAQRRKVIGLVKEMA